MSIQNNTLEECKDNRFGKENAGRDNEAAVAWIKILAVRSTLFSFNEISHLEEISGQWWTFVVYFSAFFCLHSVQVGPGGKGVNTDLATRCLRVQFQPLHITIIMTVVRQHPHQQHPHHHHHHPYLMGGHLQESHSATLDFTIFRMDLICMSFIAITLRWPWWRRGCWRWWWWWCWRWGWWWCWRWRWWWWPKPSSPIPLGLKHIHPSWASPGKPAAIILQY